MNTNFFTPLWRSLLTNRSALTVPVAHGGDTVAAADVLEFHQYLLGLGYVCDDDLSDAMTALDQATFNEVAGETLRALMDHLGASDRHVALFRDFPNGISGRMVYLDYDRLPIVPKVVEAADLPQREFAHPNQVQRALTLASDTIVADTALELLTRTSPLSPADTALLTLILDEIDLDFVDSLPASIPVKETMALTVATLTDRNRQLLPQLLHSYADTATDLLRITSVLMGADASLLALPACKGRNLSRPVRRAIVARLNTFVLDFAAEELLNRAEYTKRLFRGLHVFEYAKEYPNAATLMTLVCANTLTKGTLGERIAACVETANFIEVDDHRKLVFHSWNSRVETAFTDGDIGTAIALLSERGGMFARSLDRLLVAMDKSDEDYTPDLIEALSDAVTGAATPLLLSVVSHLRARTVDRATRLFIPKGPMPNAYITNDPRDPLDAETVDLVTSCIEFELMKRLHNDDAAKTAIVDEELRLRLLPIGERNASDSLDAAPRGTAVRLPDEPIRFFLHWTESDRRVDLDLSAAFYKDDFSYAGTCNYTALNPFHDNTAVHSGDYTSAPAPHGATEFIDLQPAGLKKQGIRYVLANVLSYNGVPFDEMGEAYAGSMKIIGREQFDPAAITAKFEMTGSAHTMFAQLIDLEEMTCSWVDMKQPKRSKYLSVNGMYNTMSQLTASFLEWVATRPTDFDLALLNACANADTVIVRDRDGARTATHRNGRDNIDFLRAVRTGGTAVDDVEGAVEYDVHELLQNVTA